MNLIDYIFVATHYHNRKHRTLTRLSWNFHKIFAMITRRYSCTKTETGLVLEEVVEYERRINRSEKQ